MKKKKLKKRLKNVVDRLRRSCERLVDSPFSLRGKAHMKSACALFLKPRGFFVFVLKQSSISGKTRKRRLAFRTHLLSVSCITRDKVQEIKKEGACLLVPRYYIHFASGKRKKMRMLTIALPRMLCRIDRQSADDEFMHKETAWF